LKISYLEALRACIDPDKAHKTDIQYDRTIFNSIDYLKLTFNMTIF